MESTSIKVMVHEESGIEVSSSIFAEFNVDGDLDLIHHNHSIDGDTAYSKLDGFEKVECEDCFAIIWTFESASGDLVQLHANSKAINGHLLHIHEMSR